VNIILSRNLIFTKLGVVVSPTDYKKPGNEFVVARALWDSHWREEVAILCDSSISFYTPLSKKADISIRKYIHGSYLQRRIIT